MFTLLLVTYGVMSVPLFSESRIVSFYVVLASARPLI